MHPVTERWLLLERLDNYVMVAVVVLAVASGLVWLWGLRRPRRWKEALANVLTDLAIIIPVLYVLWRIEYGWKGIYHP